MKKRVLSLLLIFSIVLPLCTQAYAVDNSMTYANATNGKVSLETNVSECISDMIEGFYSGIKGEYVVGEPIPIYNADVKNIYYIIPVLRNQQCVGMIEVDTSGNAALSDDVSLYDAVSEITSAEHVLYTTGGVTYAETPSERIKLYECDFGVLANDSFLLNSYTNKKQKIASDKELAREHIDISAVAKQSKTIKITEKTTRGATPSVVYKECAITDFVSQGVRTICWAACTATIVNYKKDLELTAEEVSEAMGHDNTDIFGNLGEYADGIIEALAMYNVSYRTINGKLSWANVKSNINNDDPFIIGMTGYYVNNSTLASGYTSHVYVGYGYQHKNGDSSADANHRYVQAWNPEGHRITFQHNASSYPRNGYPWTWEQTIID